MEALQLHSGSIESSQHLTSKKSTPLHTVKNLFKRVSSTPLSIVASPASSLEPTVSNSAISSGGTASEPITEANTAATSLEFLPTTFVFQGYHVSPSMAVNENIQALWSEKIKSRLSGVLRYNVPKGICVQEVMMAGKRPEALKPTLIVSCGDTATKRCVGKTFKTQGWLQALLKANHITFIALVADTRLSTGPVGDVTDTTRLTDCCAVQVPPSVVTTSCGLAVRTNVDADANIQQSCVLGGLLLVNGEIMGLTAGHSFTKVEDYPTGRGIEEFSAIDGETSDDDSSRRSSEPFIFNGDDDPDTNDCSIESSASLQEQMSNDSSPRHTKQAERFDHPDLDSAEWYQLPGAILPVPTQSHTLPGKMDPSDYGWAHDDWALLEALPSALTSQPNKVPCLGFCDDIQIEGTITGPVGGDVRIITATGRSQSGNLHSSPAIINVDGAAFEVQLITLDHALREYLFRPKP